MIYGQDPSQPSGPSQYGEPGGGSHRGPFRPRGPYQGPQPQPGPSPHELRPRPSPYEPQPAAAQGRSHADLGEEPEVAYTQRSRSGGRSGGTSTGPGHSRRARAESDSVAPPSGPGRINDDIDLDEVDPKGRAQRKAAKEAALAARPAKRHRVLKYTAWGTAGTLVAVAALGFYVINHLLGSVQTVSLDNLRNRPAASKANAEGQTPLNILVLGSQTRDGQNLAAHVGNSSKAGTDLSDTAFIVHISANRKWTEVISIPRDVFVPIPACVSRTDPNHTYPAQSEGQFYTAMNEGGPACAVATVEQMTNIRMDHFIELTFNAFIQLTDAVDGVTICVPEPGIDDPNYSGLVLSAGLHSVSGNQALAFVRDRHGLAGGMDTQRIKMQQQFMTALFNKLTANGTLKDPVTLYKIANAISSNITVDSGLDNISTMAQIAESVGTINKKYIQYITAPYHLDSPGEFSYDESGNHSSPGPGFDALWSFMRDDQPLPGSAAAELGTKTTATETTSASPAAPASASANPSPTVALKDVTVKVDNGTDITGGAHNAINYLTGVGMTASLGDGGYGTGYTTTTIYYPPGDQAEADTVANQIVGSVVKESSNVSSVTLVIGTNVPHAVVASSSSLSSSGSGSPSADSTASASASTTASISAEARTGDENICSNLPSGQYGGHP